MNNHGYRAPDLTYPIVLVQNSSGQPYDSFNVVLRYMPPDLSQPIILESDNGQPARPSFHITLDPKNDGSIGNTTFILVQGLAGIEPSEDHSIKLKFSYVYVGGIAKNTLYGAANIRNASAGIKVLGIPSGSHGKPTVYNFLQRTSLQGKDQSSYGLAYLQGGVKWLGVKSVFSFGAGKPSLINTTANQYAYPSGIARTTAIPAPTITPHTIFARGIYGTSFGVTKLIPTPVLRHKGVNRFIAGTPTVWFHTRPMQAKSIGSYATGYPRVFDPTQRTSPSPMLRSSVFGDVRIHNNNSHLFAPSIFSQAVSDWATVEARNRTLYAKSFVEQAFGNQLIKNKTPSIFFHGLPAPIFYSQNIGYRIRLITTRGVDSLLIGRPTVVKTPELLPRSYAATLFGNQWVSNSTRYIENYGSNYGSAGLPTVWFRYRHVRAKSWQSSAFSSRSTVTHGVREILANGFIRQGYGNAWVTHGTRQLNAKSVYQEFASKHYVGRHQEIKPQGYISTLFGTRITPISQSLYAQGFVGVIGQSAIRLHTRYISVKGYLSAGEQPAFRWGRQIVYNSIQHIKQDFDGNNGLVPPKWSSWTLIENRNKRIGAYGFLSQRFGYSQTNNNARSLLTKAIAPLLIDKPIISHSVRYLSFNGIAPFPMSAWGVVHNDARVIAAHGFIATDFGVAGAVNTRRYYSGVGRIDSLDAGVPMVAYRIRRLEIEKRYSIAPPIIRLPTIDVWNKYVTFRGFESAAYGLASLSIHFNIIRTRWSHRDNQGFPFVKNLTPELGIYGHNSELFGTTAIRTQWRNVYAQGQVATLFGPMRIADTKQSISIAGWRDTVVAQKHTVIRTGAPPYSEQRIDLDGYYDYSKPDGDEYISGYGIFFDETLLGKRIPNPGLNQNVLYGRGFTASQYGTAFMYSNNIEIVAGIAIHNVGGDTFVSNRDRYISLEGIKPIDAAIEMGTPRLSPHTIYSVKNAPAQAIENHYKHTEQIYYVGENRSRPSGFVVGTPKVESTIRSVYPWNVSTTGYGKPSLALKLKLITVKGFRRAAFGIPSIPFTPQYIDVFNNDNPANKFGAQSLHIPDTGDKTIRLSGIAAPAISKHDLQLKTRYLLVWGKDSLAMGTRKAYDSPYMWQGLRVGEHVPMAIGAGDTSLFGTSFVSLRVRDLVLDGFDGFISEYDVSSFKDRMRVNHKKQTVDDMKRVTTDSFTSSAFGYNNIKLGQHYIRPDGSSDQFRKGGYHA